MKKILSVLLVLCIAATLFAATGVTVKVGSAFAFFNEKTAKFDDTYHSYERFKGHGFGFDAEVQYDISDKLLVFASYGKVFPSDAYMMTCDDDSPNTKWNSIYEDLVYEGLERKLKINFMDITAGVAYKFDFNAFKLAVGCGIAFNRLMIKATFTPEVNHDDPYTETLKYTLSNFAVIGYAEAKYLVAENVGITLTAKPQLNFYSFYNYYCKSHDDPDVLNEKYKGIALGFAMPVALGVSYSF